MFWFKCKDSAHKENKKATTELESYEQLYDIGMTKVKLVFLDGRDFTMNIYGNIYQYYNPSSDETAWHSMREARVEKERVTTSLLNAQLFIQNINNNLLGYVDDIKNVKTSIIGEVRYAEILETSSYNEMCTLWKVVPRKEVMEKTNV